MKMAWAVLSVASAPFWLLVPRTPRTPSRGV
jgi:hypothetical protein